MSCLIVGHHVCAQENEQNLQRLVFGDVIRYDSSTSNGMARNYRTQWIMEGATRLSRGLIFDFTRLPFLKTLKSFCFELSSRKPRAISTSNECYWLSRYDKMVSERHEIHILTVPTGTHRDRLRTARYRPKRLKTTPATHPILSASVVFSASYRYGRVQNSLSYAIIFGVRSSIHYPVGLLNLLSQDSRTYSRNSRMIICLRISHMYMHSPHT